MATVTIFHNPRCGTSRNTLGLIRNAMLRHPILINRPFVLTERGTRLCRPSELVLEILSQPQRGYFAKEDGEVVINERGERVGR